MSNTTTQIDRLYGDDGIDERPWTLSSAPYEFYYTEAELDADDDPEPPGPGGGDRGPSALVPVRSQADVPGFPSALVSVVADGTAFEVALIVADAGEDFDFNFDVPGALPVIVPEIGAVFNYGRPCCVRRFDTRDKAAAYQVALVRWAAVYAFTARVMAAQVFVVYVPNATSAKAAAIEAQVLRRAVDDADPLDPFEGRVSRPAGTPVSAVPFVEVAS